MDKDLRDKGLVIMGFPCNQFGQQEPGTHEQIKQFIKKYDVQFPMFQKIDVNGVNCHPLYNYLRRNSELQSQKEDKTGTIPWNFAKFVINRNGEVIKYAHPKEDAQSLRSIIEEELNK